ncbi:NHL repeat-containing protein [Gracilimonas sp.]|uniref:NHL repeat-containing protein n=1 Tax=Gracilimonas sp. TaxID=1974203 RepID=UPI003BAD2E9F
MNFEHRILNDEVGLLPVIIRVCCSFLFSILILTHTSGQSLQTLYSGLDKATGLYVTQNSVYVVEQGKDRVLKLDHSGKLLDTIGGKGGGNYQFSKPVDVDATNGLKVFVSDYNNRRIQVFDRRGQYLSSISASDAFGNNRPYNPTQVAVNGLGEVFFVDEAGNYIRRFDLDSNLLDEFRIPSEINSVDEMNVTSREILILDKPSETIHRLSLNGNYEGFYPAEDVKALFASESGVWRAHSDQVKFENRSKQRRVFPFSSKVEAIDMHVLEEVVFILSSGDLYKIRISE